MRIAIITAGGAGMFCGSCMHDNTWARALRDAGAEVTLIPTYTPVRVDEEDLSDQRIFFGGINVYLEYRSPLWRRIPRPLTRWLDRPWVVNLATQFGVSNDAHHLGALTLAMLQGEAGPQRTDVDELADFLGGTLKPDVVCFSNALLVGVLHNLKQRFDGQIFCTLQGDDIFLEDLPEPYRSDAIAAISERAQQFDGFLVHSRYYRDFMSDYLKLPNERFQQIPLGIDLKDHDGQPELRHNDQFTVGYFARICPEKGLHRLIDAFRILHAKHPNTRLRAGGYLGKRDQKYFARLMRDVAGLGPAFEYIGSPDSHSQKVEFLKSLDVLSVPTEYHEPKGLSILEALANGVPVVQPRHGAFPELIEATGGGELVEPDNAQALADGLERMMIDPDRRLELARSGHAKVRELFSGEFMARQTIAVFEQSLKGTP